LAYYFTIDAAILPFLFFHRYFSFTENLMKRQQRKKKRPILNKNELFSMNECMIKVNPFESILHSFDGCAIYQINV